MIEVPHEILAARDIIFAYEIDGKPLAEKAKPIRAVLPEERAMYWVRNLKTVEILRTGLPRRWTNSCLLKALPHPGAA